MQQIYKHTSQHNTHKIHLQIQISKKVRKKGHIELKENIYIA